MTQIKMSKVQSSRLAYDCLFVFVTFFFQRFPEFIENFGVFIIITSKLGDLVAGLVQIFFFSTLGLIHDIRSPFDFQNSQTA